MLLNVNYALKLKKKMWVWFRPPYQNEVKCSAFDMVFHKKGCAHGLIMKVRVFGTQKRPICFVNSRVLLQVISKLFKLGSFKTFKKQVPIQGPILRVYSLHKYRFFQIPI